MDWYPLVGLGGRVGIVIAVLAYGQAGSAVLGPPSLRGHLHLLADQTHARPNASRQQIQEGSGR